MKFGYLPNNLTSVGECELYMLPGLAAEFDACRIAGLTISRIDFGLGGFHMRMLILAIAAAISSAAVPSKL